MSALPRYFRHPPARRERGRRRPRFRGSERCSRSFDGPVGAGRLAGCRFVCRSACPSFALAAVGEVAAPVGDGVAAISRQDPPAASSLLAGDPLVRVRLDEGGRRRRVDVANGQRGPTVWRGEADDPATGGAGVVRPAARHEVWAAVLRLMRRGWRQAAQMHDGGEARDRRVDVMPG